MSLKEFFRFATQSRKFYCYLILTLWILLLVGGMYKNIGNTEHSLGNFFQYSLATESSGDNSIIGNLQQFENYKATCSPVHQIIRGEHGGILEGWKLQGLILVIRHGDRGPMSHIRNIRNIDCGIAGDPLVNRFKSFLHNSTSPSESNHMYWNKVGPFHGFALLPAADKNCFLGQLTYKGIAQQLHIGEILHQIYAHSLGLLGQGKSVDKASTPSTPHLLFNSDEVVLYATRYRRTFQSAMALLYTFLPTEKWLSLNVKESHSMAFCFTDCTCSQADFLRKQTRLFYDKILSSKKKVNYVMQEIGNILLDHIPNGYNLGEIVDGTLIFLCNNAPLPCRQYRPVNISLQNILINTKVNDKTLNKEFVDTINIDQEEQNNVNIKKSLVVNKIGEMKWEAKKELLAPMRKSCIEPHHVETLMNYAFQESANEANHFHYKRIGLLRAYGMIRHIVSYMLKMVSGDRTKMVLYSGHSRTLQYLTAALGIKTETTYIPYAARLALELYKSEAHIDYYFRVVYNGHDVTQQLDFCEGGKSLRVTRDSRGNKADLCPIENIIRFLHEDYFALLNSTNFKESCTTSTYK